VILDFAMKQQFLNAMDTCLRRAVQPQVLPKNTLNTILTIAEKRDVANDATGIYRYPGSK
jgi:hypothetical protein